MDTTATVVTEETEATLEADVLAAVESARAHLQPRYQPFNLRPEIYVVTYTHPQGELACVLLPAQLPQIQEVYNRAKSQPDRMPELMLGQVLWWVRGQPEDGAREAVKYLRQLAQIVGGTLAMAPGKIVDAYTEVVDKGGTAAAKKLLS